MGDLGFQNNVPDPLLSGKELPTFKFELEKSRGKVFGNSFGKESNSGAVADLKRNRGRIVNSQISAQRRVYCPR